MQSTTIAAQSIAVLVDLASKIALDLEDAKPAPGLGWDQLHALHSAISALVYLIDNPLLEVNIS
jgi:hypothetical protein